MQNFLSLWLNAGAQITHGGQVQRPRQGNALESFPMGPFCLEYRKFIHMSYVESA